MLPLLCSAVLAWGQTAPDAGTLLREQPKPPEAPRAPVQPLGVDKPAAKPDENGPRVLVKAVRVEGNTLIPGADLVAQVRGLVGSEHSLGELRNAELVLAGEYIRRGYVARVFLPPQNIKDGVVTYQVVEGVFGSLKIDKTGERLDAERIRRFINARLAAGEVMDLDALSGALQILNEQPGVAVKSVLSRGSGERAMDVNVTATEKPLASYNLGLSNQGSRSTGVWQASGGATLANPSGHFDALSAFVNTSQGSTYGRAEYSLALGDRGLRLGVNASALHYNLVQASFAALQASGTADTFGMNASYPLVRRNAFALDLTGRLDRKRLVDRTVTGETGNRTVDVAGIGLSGYMTATEGLLQGVRVFGANLAAGSIDQRNAAALAADQAGRMTQGGYTKLEWNLGLIRSLDENWNINAAVRGQFADKNLDSSERFALGGPTGIRAYPVAEAVGDEGWLANLNVGRRLGSQFSLGGFVDFGGVTINHAVPAAGTTTPNRYTLAGAGVTLGWQPSNRMSLNATLAAPLGSNPGRDVNGKNNDGSAANSARVWLTFAMQL